MNEIWVNAYQSNGSYLVSNIGRVKSVRRGKILVRAILNNGYRNVTIRVNGKLKTISAHKLVWESFYGPVTTGMVINHKNCDGKDNRLENLELVTYSENLSHAYLNGRRKTKMLDKKTVLEIYNKHGTHREIAKIYGINYSLVYQIKNKITYKYYLGIGDNKYAK